MKLREQLYGEHTSYADEKRYASTVTNSVFSAVWSRNPDLRPTEGDGGTERSRKGNELERLTFEGVLVDAIDATTLHPQTIASELRRIASLLESLEYNEER